MSLGAMDWGGLSGSRGPQETEGRSSLTALRGHQPSCPWVRAARSDTAVVQSHPECGSCHTNPRTRVAGGRRGNEQVDVGCAKEGEKRSNSRVREVPPLCRWRSGKVPLAEWHQVRPGEGQGSVDSRGRAFQSSEVQGQRPSGGSRPGHSHRSPGGIPGPSPSLTRPSLHSKLPFQHAWSSATSLPPLRSPAAGHPPLLLGSFRNLFMETSFRVSSSCLFTPGPTSLFPAPPRAAASTPGHVSPLDSPAPRPPPLQAASTVPCPLGATLPHLLLPWLQPHWPRCWVVNVPRLLLPQAPRTAVPSPWSALSQDVTKVAQRPPG